VLLIQPFADDILGLNHQLAVQDGQQAGLITGGVLDHDDDPDTDAFRVEIDIHGIFGVLDQGDQQIGVAGPHKLAVNAFGRGFTGQENFAVGQQIDRDAKAQRFDIPLLLMSNEPDNARRALDIPASFVDKNSPCLLADVRGFVLERLGFGDFIFRGPQGEEISRAGSLYALEERLKTIPAEALADLEEVRGRIEILGVEICHNTLLPLLPSVPDHLDHSGPQELR